MSDNPLRPEDIGQSVTKKAKQTLSLLPGLSSEETCECGATMTATHTFAPSQMQRVPSFECPDCDRAVYRDG